MPGVNSCAQPFSQLSWPERTPDGQNASLPLSWWSVLGSIVSGALKIPWVRRRFPLKQPQVARRPSTPSSLRAYLFWIPGRIWACVGLGARCGWLLRARAADFPRQGAYGWISDGSWLSRTVFGSPLASRVCSFLSQLMPPRRRCDGQNAGLPLSWRPRLDSIVSGAFELP
jgi:hypothetical protein